MQEAHALSTIAAPKITTMAYLAAHPVGVAIVGGILIGSGAFYLVGKLVNRKQAKTADATSGDVAATVA